MRRNFLSLGGKMVTVMLLLSALCAVCWRAAVTICSSSDTAGLKRRLSLLGSGWLCRVSNAVPWGRGLGKAGGIGAKGQSSS